MYSITTQKLTLQEADSRFGAILDLTHPDFETPPGTVLGVEVPIPLDSNDLSPGEQESPELPTLFIWLPNYEGWQLQELASMELWTIGMHSKNLLHAESFVVLGPEDGGVYIPMGLTRLFYIHEEAPTIRLVLIGSDAVIDARHHYTGDHFEAFVCGAQAQTSGSGNYSCTRFYSEEELNEAASLGDDYSVTGHLVRLCRLSSED